MKTICVPNVLLLFVIGINLCVMSAGHAQVPGQRLTDQVKAAYDKQPVYHAKIEITLEQRTGRWTMKQHATFELAYDRQATRLLLDSAGMPGDTAMQLVVNDGKLLFRVENMPADHVETAAPAPLTCEALYERLPWISQPLMPDMAFLLSEQPIALLTGGAVASASPLAPAADDPLQRPRLQCVLHDGTLTLTIDPQTRLIAEAEFAFNQGPDAALGDFMRLHYIYNIQPTVDTIAPAVFAFDTTHSFGHDSLQDMLQSLHMGMAGAGPMNVRAPNFTLKNQQNDNVTLHDVAEKIVVLDFWATWRRTCAEALAQTQAVHDWAKQENKPVAFYAINIAESPQEAAAYCEHHNLTLPVLFDTDAAVADQFGVTGIPYTVIIADGRIRYAHEEYNEGTVALMKEQITTLLEELAENADEPQTLDESEG